MLDVRVSSRTHDTLEATHPGEVPEPDTQFLTPELLTRVPDTTSMFQNSTGSTRDKDLSQTQGHNSPCCLFNRLNSESHK